MDGSSTDDLRARQRDAIWKWCWLGWRECTPAFKGSIVPLIVVAAALAAYATGLLRF